MSQEHDTSENFCTFQELKEFTNNFTDLNLINISKFIEAKTNKKYCIIKKELVSDLYKQLFDNNIAILDINQFLIEIWSKVNQQNHNIINKWKHDLKVLNLKEGK